ncbi:MAG: TfoX/Sxy family protein [Pseudomonadales bacterium]|nr:TfoX/Sxy family protein [Pseudomonadales bacterium]
MATREDQEEFASHVVDLLQSVGPCYSKRMFGGYGIFLDGLMFGLIADNDLYLKVDDENREDFATLGLQPFTYVKNDKPMQMSYSQAPEEAMEDLDVMREWGAKAFAAALRAASKKSKTSKKKPKSKS